MSGYFVREHRLGTKQQSATASAATPSKSDRTVKSSVSSDLEEPYSDSFWTSLAPAFTCPTFRGLT